ncbi:MAG TPA: hypothetical protein VHQ98_12155 [Gaiellaceae bacterium]|jgi:hypothetical protein|nr:hypothetical protein [Gaiellaceae bacterium]
MPVRLPLLAVAVLAFGAAACGGGSDRLTKSEFVTRADAICAKYEQRVRAEMRGVPAGNSAELASAIERVLPVIRKGNDELRVLSPPESLQDRYDRWIQIADAEVDAAKKLHDALRDNDQPGVQTAFKQLQQRDADQDRLAREQLGLTGCASGSSG